jgi:hypothetical protein
MCAVLAVILIPLVSYATPTWSDRSGLVEVSVGVNTNEARLGEPIICAVDVLSPVGADVTFPELYGEFNGLVILQQTVSTPRLEEDRLHQRMRLVVEQQFPDDATIPALTVTVSIDGNIHQLTSEPLTLPFVSTLPGAAESITLRENAADVGPMPVGAVVLIAFAVIAVLTALRLRETQLDDAVVPSEIRSAADARRGIEQLPQTGALSAYYLAIGGIFNEYLAMAYGFTLRGATVAEAAARIGSTIPAPRADSLVTLLQQGEALKYAGADGCIEYREAVCAWLSAEPTTQNPEPLNP